MIYNLKMTKQDFAFLIIFIFASITTIGLYLHFDYYNDQLEQKITLIVYGLSMVLLFLLWLDEKDILTFRVRKERLTKCSVCERTYVSKSLSTDDDEDDSPIERTTIEKSGDIEQTTVTSKYRAGKDVPVNGIVVNGRLVCDQCIDAIKETYKKWQ